MSNEVIFGDMIFLTIPREWIKTYHSLLYMLTSVGKKIIDDCTYTCQGSGRNVFTCWNLFQSALAAKALGANKKAQFFIDYINSQLKLFADREHIVFPDLEMDNPYCAYRLNDDGSFTFYIRCIVDGITYTREFTIPEHYYYYGALEIDNVDYVNLDDLINSPTPLVGQELNITTTEENRYIWFVSGTPIKFVQAGLPLTLTEIIKDNLHYYRTDKLIAGADNIFIINAG